jgi:acyl-coenzyme A synthetase/AMP-(fatty) acid ligase
VGYIPKSASGKILRKVLRDRAEKDKEGNSVMVWDERTSRAKL